MSRPTLQTIDQKIAVNRSTLLFFVWAFGLNVVVLIWTLQSGRSAQSNHAVVLRAAQLTYLFLALPFMVSLGLRHVELLFQKYDCS